MSTWKHEQLQREERFWADVVVRTPARASTAQTCTYCVCFDYCGYSRRREEVAMTALTLAPVQPDESDISAAVEALPHVKDYLATHTDSVIRLVVADEHEETLVVPRAAVELLARVLAHMAAGQGVSVVPAHAELTTQQAAELLNVSRPFLIGLLDAGDIEYRRVGTHRRIMARSLMAFMARDDQQRREAADELTRLNQEMGML